MLGGVSTFAFSLAALASIKLTAGYTPKAKSFCLPSNLYYKRQYLLFGLT